MTDEAKIIDSVAERLHFFFSDANLRRDKFLRKELDENEGSVSIETLLKFNSIKQHTTDPSAIAKAAKSERVADCIKLSDDEKLISRIVPFDMKTMSDNTNLALRIDNLPTEVTEGSEEEKNGEKKHKKYAVSRDEVRELFSKYGTVALVDMLHHRPKWTKNTGDEDNKASPSRRHPIPTGAAFVEFEKAEALERAAADLCADEDKAPTTTLTLGGNDLEVMTMKEWVERKGAKKRESRKLKAGEDPGEVPSSKRARIDESEESKVKADFKPFELDWEKGCVISLKGLAEDCDREAIRDAVATFLGHTGDDKDLNVWADFSRGQKDGAIRFKEPSDKISELVAKLNGGTVTISGAKVESAKLLEGEEEETYYKNFIEFKNKQRQQKAEEGGRLKKQRGRGFRR